MLTCSQKSLNKVYQTSHNNRRYSHSLLWVGVHAAVYPECGNMLTVGFAAFAKSSSATQYTPEPRGTVTKKMSTSWY